MKRLKVFEVSGARSVIKYFFRSRGNGDLFFNYLVSFDLINAFQKRSLVSQQLYNKGKVQIPQDWFGSPTRMASVSFLSDTNMANWMSCECHVDFGYRTFDRLRWETVTSGYVVVFQCQITKTRISQLKKLREYTVSCYKPFSWTEKAVETFN